jgi:cysteine-rich repeat protein
MGRMGRAVTGVALVAMAALVACIRANTVACGDLSCPEALQCVAERCVTTEQVESCSSLMEGDACKAAGVINGHCIGGACVDSICGNEIVELGEVCDDGNVVGEDGCAARCDSNETCGNATVDLFREQCDDGIASLSGDGCSSQCSVEYPTWRRETPRELVGRVDHAMVTIDRPNASDSMILLFGGTTSTAPATNETWIWQTNQWRQLRPRTTPPAIKNPVLVYDARRRRVVLFTGTDPLSVWEWDGVDWSQRTQTGEPPKAVVVGGYHEATQQVVAFDGAVSFQWTGTAWIKHPGPHPSARTATVMAYFKTSDATGNLVMFGGRGPTLLLDDTWEFDGTRWREAMLGGAGPRARQSAMMAWDPEAGRIVLFGGLDIGSPLGDTWLYNGAWTAGVAAQGLRRSAAMAFDPINRRVMVHGGQGAALNSFTDQQAYTSSWISIANPSKPSAACSGTLTYLPAVGETVFTAVDKSWRWDGIQWNINTVAPSQRCTPAAASSPSGTHVVLFGGSVTGSNFAFDTWTWNGKTWTQIPDSAPGVRSGPAMALDEKSGRTVLFGGRGVPTGPGNSGPVFADTWEWNGSAWALRTTVDAPARHGHSLAFDRTTQTLVMFGGQDMDGLASTTFELDGMTWRPLLTANAPLATPPVVMGTGSRGRPVLLDAARQTWELQRENGVADWIRMPTIGAPPALASSSLAYDPLRDQLLLVGAVSGEVQVWSLTFVSPQPRESCFAADNLDSDIAAGCADPDCWAICDPQCPPVAAMTCATSRPRCGDGACAAIENYQVCPADCLPPP